MIKIEYRGIDSGEVFDVISIDGMTVSYRTGKARDLVENRIRLLGGVRAAARNLSGWSNGYVETVAVPIR